MQPEGRSARAAALASIEARLGGLGWSSLGLSARAAALASIEARPADDRAPETFACQPGQLPWPPLKHIDAGAASNLVTGQPGQLPWPPLKRNDDVRIEDNLHQVSQGSCPGLH